MGNSDGDTRSPDNRTGSRPVRVMDTGTSSAIPERVFVLDLHSRNSPGLILVVRSGAPVMDSLAGTFSTIRTRRSEFLYGRGLRRIALMMLKMAVFAPVPSPKVKIATTTN